MTQIEKDTILDFASSDISLNEFYEKIEFKMQNYKK